MSVQHIFMAICYQCTSFGQTYQLEIATSWAMNPHQGTSTIAHPALHRNWHKHSMRIVYYTAHNFAMPWDKIHAVEQGRWCAGSYQGEPASTEDRNEILMATRTTYSIQTISNYINLNTQPWIRSLNGIPGVTHIWFQSKLLSNQIAHRDVGYRSEWRHR